MSLAELSRKVENMIRIGTISEVDHAARRVRVQSGSLLTDWLKWRVGRAGETRTWCPPTIGEQVMILSPSGELANGIVTPAIYSDAYDAPSSDASMHVIAFPDGAQITYNHTSGALAVSGIKTAIVRAEESVTVDCPQTTATGDVTVLGNLLVKGLLRYLSGMQGSGDAGGGASAVIYGDVIIGGKSVLQHTHSDQEGGNVGVMQ